MNGKFAGLAFYRTWLFRCGAFFERGGLLPVPGAAVLLQRDAVVDVGGVRTGLPELVLRLQAHARRAGKPARVGLMPDSVAWPRPMKTSEELNAWLVRDQREIGSLWRVRRDKDLDGVDRRGVGRLFRSQVLQPAVETLGFVLLAGALALGRCDAATAGCFLLASIGGGMLVSTAAVVLRGMVAPDSADPRELGGMFRAAIAENFGHRQVRNVRLLRAFWSR